MTSVREAPVPVTADRVAQSLDGLPSFPGIVQKILDTIDDPDSNLHALVDYIERDAVIASRVLSVANRADSTHVGSRVTDVFAATSLIGLRRLREVVIVAVLVDFLRDLAPDSMPAVLLDFFWKDSVVTAVSCVEVAREARCDVSLELALIGGLVHNIGQLWLERFEPARFEAAMAAAAENRLDVCAAEVDAFGVDHAQVGAWLAAAWGLSEVLVKVIEQHHRPLQPAAQPLVAVVHVGEILSNALDLARSPYSAVTRLSQECCDVLGLAWGERAHGLFGRIEARAHHALAMMK